MAIEIFFNGVEVVEVCKLNVGELKFVVVMIEVLVDFKNVCFDVWEEWDWLCVYDVVFMFDCEGVGSSSSEVKNFGEKFGFCYVCGVEVIDICDGYGMYLKEFRLRNLNLCEDDKLLKIVIGTRRIFTFAFDMA